MKRSGLGLKWIESVWKCCWVPTGKFSVWNGHAWRPYRRESRATMCSLQAMRLTSSLKV